MVTPGSRLVALRRTTVDAGSVAAVLATVIVVCALVTGVVATLPTLQQQALRRAVGSLPAADRVVVVVGSGEAAAAEPVDGRVRAALAPLVQPAGGTVVRQVRTVAHRQVGSARSWSLTAVEADGGEVLEVVTGRLPRAAAGPLEVAVPAGTPLDPGTRMVLESPLDGTRLPAEVVGSWRPTVGTGAVEPDPGALLVDPASVAGLVGRGSSVRWAAEPSEGRLRPDHLEELLAATATVATAVDTAGERTGTSLRLENPLTDVLQARGRELLAQRMLLLVPALLLLLLGAASAMLVATALAHNRRGDEWLLRSRGADRRQLVAPTALEASAVCAAAAVSGPLLAAAVVRIGGARPELGVTAWAAGAVAAAVCWAALVLPTVVAALGGDRGEQLSLERRRRRMLTGVLAAGLLLVAAGVVAVVRLEGFAARVAGGWSGGIDPLLVAAPSLLVAAVASLLVLALVPVLFRLVERSVRSRGVALTVGTRAAARAPAKAVPLALTVALVAAGVAFASTGRASQEGARQARASYDVGADVRVTAPPSSFRMTPDAERKELERTPGVLDVSAVDREAKYVDDVATEVLVADLSGAAGRSLVALSGSPTTLVGRLTVPDPGTVPVAVTPELADRASLDVGRVFDLALGDRDVTLTVAAVVPVLPTLAEGRAGILLDRGALGPDAPAAPDEWWLAVVDGAADRVAAALEDRPRLAARVLTRDRALERLADDPGTGGAALADVMAVTALGSAVVGVVLLVSVVVLRRRERDAQSAALRALGASGRDVTMSVATEYTLVTGGGLLAGAVAGVVSAAVALDATALGAGGSRLVPAPELDVPWLALGVLLGVLLLVPMTALLVLTRTAPRSGPAVRALRAEGGR